MRPAKAIQRRIARGMARLRSARSGSVTPATPATLARSAGPASRAGAAGPGGTGEERPASTAEKGELPADNAAGEGGPPATSMPRHPAEAVPWSMRVAAAWSWRVLLVGAVIAGLLYLLWMFRLVMLPVFVAMLLTALLQPTVSWLRRLGAPHLLATAVVFVGGISIVGGTFYGLSELVIAGLNDLGDAVTRGIEQVRLWLEQGALPLQFETLNELTNRAQQWVQDNIQRVTRGAVTTVTVVSRLLAGLLLALVVTFFFLYDGGRIWGWLVKLFPRSVEEGVDGAGRRAWDTLAGYVQGTVIVALFDAVLIGILLFAVRLPVSLVVPLAVLVFFAAFVPLLGALATGILAVLVTLVTQNLLFAVITLIGVVAIQQIEGNLLQPLVLSRMVRLHPLAVLLTVTAGAIIAGVAGAVVAVPLAAVINTTTGYFFRRHET